MKANLPIWRRLLLASEYTLAGILVLAAVASSIVRLYPSLYQDYLPAIQKSISSLVGKPVRIETIHVEWHGYDPQVTVHGLSVDTDGSGQEQLLLAEKAVVSVDLFRSLIDGEIAVTELQLDGGNLEILRTDDQRIVMNGIDISERISARTGVDGAGGFRVKLVDTSIDYRDDVLDLDLRAERSNVVFDFKGGKLRLASSLHLPDAQGTSLALAADMEGLEQGLDGVRGTLYVKGDRITIGLLGRFFPKFSAGIHSGHADFEIWGDINSRDDRSFRGSLALLDLGFRNAEDPARYSGHEIMALETGFQLNGSASSWHLALVDSDIRTAEGKWAGGKYEIRCRDCETAHPEVTAALDYVNLADMLETLENFPPLSERLSGWMRNVHPEGEIRDMRFSALWQEEHLAKYAYEAALDGLDMTVPEYELEVSSLSGRVTGNHLQGSLEIDSPAVEVKARQLAENTFPSQQITGLVKWKLSGKRVVLALERVSLAAEEVDASLQGIVQIEPGKSYADLQGEVSRASLSALKDWLPHKRMNQKLVRWLREAIKQGTLSHARFLFNGDAGRFPFDGRSGRFELQAEVEEGLLEYRKNWPMIRNIAADVEVSNGEFHVQGTEARVLDSRIHAFTTSIEDVRLPRLTIHGRGSGPASDTLVFLEQSALIPQDSQIPGHISADGEVGLNLNIAWTLTRKLEKERHVDGLIEFKGADLVLRKASLPFTDVHGKLKFTKQGAEGTGVRAKLFGSEFDVEAALLENGRTRVQLAGALDLDSWMTANQSRASEYLRGKTPVSATFVLPQFGNLGRDESVEIRIESDLAGASITLPEPFAKEQDASSALVMHTRHQDGASHPLSVRFEDSIYIQALPDPAAAGISALEVRTENDRFELPDRGVKVTGKFDLLDITEWLEILQSGDGQNSLELDSIDIQADEISAFGLATQNARFSMEKDTQFWNGKIRSSNISGDFQYPLSPQADSVLTASFEYFRYDKPDEALSFSVDPRNLPALDIAAAKFEIGDLPVYNVAVKTSPSPEGMVVDSVSAEGSSLEITASGAWRTGPEEVQTSKFDIVMVTEDLRDSLVGLGFETGVEKGEGVLSSSFYWEGAPYQFSLDSFAGSSSIRLKDGEIVSVEPGAGRLIGLLNISVISRRLALDFSDFFSEGYAFDKIRGNLAFRDGNLTTEDLRIKGPSANIEIEGRTGIVARDYDQLVTVTPHVSGGLPWLGIPMGPAGVGGIYILGKIAEKIGIDVDKAVDRVVEVTYHMTGSWDDPKIEPVAGKAAEAESATQASKGDPENESGNEPDEEFP